MKYQVEFRDSADRSPSYERFTHYAAALVYAGRRILFEQGEMVAAILEVEPDPEQRSGDRLSAALDTATEFSEALYKLLAIPDYPGVPVEVSAGNARAVISLVPA